VKHFTHNLKTEGSYPTFGTGGEMMAKRVCQLESSRTMRKIEKDDYFPFCSSFSKTFENLFIEVEI